MKRLVSVLAVLAVVLCGPAGAGAQDDPEFMKVAELRQLLARGPVYGYFRTVTEGLTLSRYDIRIRGVVNDDGTELVVFTTAHFIAQGMSGSPVYVAGLDGNRKLLGALSYFMSPFAATVQWGGITPIEHMAAESRSPRSDASDSSSSGPVTYEGKTFIPISTDPVGSVNSGPVPSLPALKAGMPIMVDLLEYYTDGGASTVMGAMGTITYVGKNGDIYAFGHPFLGARKARYTFRACAVVGTVLSHATSFKIAGDHSDALGTIEFDGAYGVYGKIGGLHERPVTEFSVDFSSAAGRAGTYRVSVATSPLTSQIMAMALDKVGTAARVPLPRESSTATLTASVELEGHEPITFRQVFSPGQFQFGPQMFYVSSYQNAYGEFLGRVYGPLTVTGNRFAFNLTRTHLSFDFSEGVTPTLRVASVKFPDQVKWRQDPVLQVLLVSEDNNVTFSKQVVVPLDWSTIEEPTYTATTKETDKQQEKIVRGVAAVYSAEAFAEFLSADEREAENPSYFLSAEDYLAHFRKNIGRSNRLVYGRLAIRKRSGTTADDDPPDKASPGTASDAADGRQILGGWVVGAGLSERKTTVSRDPTVRFSADIPGVPAGYRVAPTRETITFEVVK